MYIYMYTYCMDDRVLGIAEARASLSSLVDRLVDRSLDHVVIGSHRKPEAMLVPFTIYPSVPPASGPMLAVLISKAPLVRRLATLSKIEAVAVFGSVARGEDGPESDIDLLIDTAPGASMFDIAAFEIDMETLFDRRVDAISRGALDPQRDARILSEAVPL